MLNASTATLRHLPLHAWHVGHGARMAPFANYEMPVSYSEGILKEHLHTRTAASLFDVSHMGQIVLRPRGGTMRDLALALETLLPIDVLSLKAGRQRYGFLTTEAGGIRDDLMIANLGRCFLLIINAGGKDDNDVYLRQRLAPYRFIQSAAPRVLLALQGPRAADALAELAPGVADMRFMDAAEQRMLGVACWVMRSGYTGEDGFEISVPLDTAQRVVDNLLRSPHVRLAGLGARDSLRLEAGLCLHGADIDRNTTPVQAALEWAIPSTRRAGGARPGGFPGAERVLAQLLDGSPERRVGLRSEQRPVRAPSALFPNEGSEQAIGRVTSGGFGPSLRAPIAMGYVPTSFAAAGTRLIAQVRDQRIPVTVTSLPFIPHRYRR
jgi:aminomethyltransferase